MSGFGKPKDFSAKRARNARRRRLEIRRTKSVPGMNRFIPENEEGRDGKKRKTGFKDVPTSESQSGSGKGSEFDDGVPSLAPGFPPSDSGSSEHSSQEGRPPVGVLVPDDEVTEEEELKCSTCLWHGSVSVIGRRRVMEDALTVAPGLVSGEFSFFAVYDGHGGSYVANACRDRLHQLLDDELEGRKSSGKLTDSEIGGGIDWEKVMVACFAKMDMEINESSRAEVEGAEPSARTVGSTAVVVVVGKEEVVVANCGDSRAVLGRGGVAVPLSRDHKVTCRHLRPSLRTLKIE